MVISKKTNCLVFLVAIFGCSWFKQPPLNVKNDLERLKMYIRFPSELKPFVKSVKYVVSTPDDEKEDDWFNNWFHGMGLQDLTNIYVNMKIDKDGWMMLDGAKCKNSSANISRRIGRLVFDDVLSKNSEHEFLLSGCGIDISRMKRKEIQINYAIRVKDSLVVKLSWVRM